MKYPDEKLILETVGEYSKNKKIADLTGQDGAYSIVALESGAKEVIINEERVEVLDTISKDLPFKIMDVNLDAFLDLCDETNEMFDMIILHSDRFPKDFDLQRDHKELIRRIQNRILNDAGILFFIVRNNSFVLDTYLKPGADKLTKKLNLDESNKAFQVWAFYN
ncbi:MAG: hypothetical protein ACMG57_04005 [Candidatus Dojkabacteria bacterium]